MRTESLPVRERGLKQGYCHEGRSRKYVAPRAGAWIETQNDYIEDQSGSVAPRAGAWIETDKSP